MKLKILDKDNGTLNVFHRNKEHKTIDNVPTANLIDWYPLSNAYEYKLSRNGEYLELKRLRSTLPTSYELETNNQSIIRDNNHRCKIGYWYNPAVRKDNLKIIDKAKQYGLPVITEEYDSNIVEQGFKDLGVIFQSLKTIVVTRYLEGKTEEELRIFNMKSEESQLNEALKESDFSVDLTYSDLGQIYNMLLLMKKISKR